MKKTLIMSLLTLATASYAGGWASVDVDQVRDNSKNHKNSQAQYVRAGFDHKGVDYSLQARTATFQGGGMVNSLELTAAKSAFGIKPFVGVGFDNGYNGGHKFNYGLVGASTGFSAGKAWVYGGIKTRVNWDSKNPDQTLAFAGVSVPVTKSVSAGIGVSKSGGDIKETAAGMGLRVQF